MKYLIYILYLLPLCVYAQKTKDNTIYLLYDQYKDEHFHEKGKVHYFRICVDDTYTDFVYGTGKKVQKIKKLDHKITDRKKLSLILANDSFENKIFFYIVEKVDDYYLIRSADYRFRMPDEDESFWTK